MMISFPPVVDFNVNGACNLNCFFCYGPSKKATEMSTAETFQCIDLLKKGGVDFVSITGGEPTLRTDLIEIVRYIKKKRMGCALHTNGHFLNEDDDLLQYLDWIALPLDGADPIAHQKVRGDSVGFGKVTSFLRWLSSSTFRPKLKVKIGTVVTRYNIHQIEGIFEILNDLDIDVWKIHEMRPRGMGTVSHRKSHVEKAAINTALDNVRFRDVKFRIAFSTTSQSDGAYVFVYPNGEVRTPLINSYLSHGLLLDPSFSFDHEKVLSTSNFRKNVLLAYGVENGT